MRRPVVLRRQARLEYDEAASWYEDRRAGLGAKFTAAVQEVLDSASEDPGRHPRVFEEVCDTERVNFVRLASAGATRRS